MTSNLGTGDADREPMGFLRDASATNSSARRRSSIEDALKKSFRPEFLNRIDEIIIFDSLSQGEIHSIVDLELLEVQERLDAHGVTIELTKAAKAWLAQEGYDLVYGARPLRRTIQRYVENPLSRQILAGDFVAVDANDAGLTFRTAEAAVTAAI
jgi:ATP-dependent Clp protease ATP-binding subunit ClpC